MHNEINEQGKFRSKYGPIIYNVTSKPHGSIAVQWLEWLKEEHIPDMVATGCFTHAVVLMMIETDETDGPVYAVQYYSETKALYNQYVQDYADTIRKKATEKWGNKIIFFRSVLQVVN